MRAAEPCDQQGDRGRGRAHRSGIALEELQGIRERVRLWRSQRATLSNWPFTSSAPSSSTRPAGPGCDDHGGSGLYLTDLPALRPRREEQPSTRDDFCCRSCGLAGPADHIAAVNVARRAGAAWVLVNAPDAAAPPSPGQDCCEPRACDQPNGPSPAHGSATAVDTQLGICSQEKRRQQWSRNRSAR